MMIRNTYPILMFICSLFQSCGKETQDNIIIDIDTDTTVVDVHGLLVVDGNKIVDKNNEPISLAGNSFFWSNDGWGGEKYYKSEVVEWLKKDWNTTIVRAAMGVEDPGGYLENKTSNIRFYQYRIYPPFLYSVSSSMAKGPCECSIGKWYSYIYYRMGIDRL